MSGKKGRMKHLCLLDAVLCVLSNRIPSQQKLRMGTVLFATTSTSTANTQYLISTPKYKKDKESFTTRTTNSMLLCACFFSSVSSTTSTTH